MEHATTVAVKEVSTRSGHRAAIDRRPDTRITMFFDGGPVDPAPSADVNQDLADVRVRLHVAVGVGDVVECEP